MSIAGPKDLGRLVDAIGSVIVLPQNIMSLDLKMRRDEFVEVTATFAAEAREQEQIKLEIAEPEKPVDYDGFTPWGGGIIPVDSNAMVFLKFRDGAPNTMEHAAGAFVWSHNGSGSDIVAYKVVQKV